MIVKLFSTYFDNSHEKYEGKIVCEFDNIVDIASKLWILGLIDARMGTRLSIPLIAVNLRQPGNHGWNDQGGVAEQLLAIEKGDRCARIGIGRH